MHPSEAKKLQRRLKREILRADKLAWTSDEQKADKSLDMKIRRDAEHRAILAIETRRELQGVLSDLEEQLNGDNS
jgi:hypothetical protein